MCGRFGLGLPRSVILRAVHHEHPELELDLDEWVDEEAFQPRFNIAPRSRSPVIRRRNNFDDRSTAATAAENKDKAAAAAAETEKNLKGAVMHTMKWGLIPHWSKHEDINLNTINAKGENLTDGGGMWTSIKGRKRCVVVCQGYYEWKKKGKERTPHFTKHKDGKLMLLAGLYDSVILEGEKEPLYTFTIVTTDANKQLSWLHDRMPLILSTPAQIRTWLDTSSQKWTPEAAKVIRPFVSPCKEHDLECYPVPKEVGKVGAESPTFIEPINKRKDGIEAMFAKQSGKSEKKDKNIDLKTKQEDSSSTPETKSVKKPSPLPPSKRKRESQGPNTKEDREDSVEVVPKDEIPGRKKARTEDMKAKQPANTDEPNLASQSSSTSSEMRKKSTKSSALSSASESVSPGTKKITNFFAKA